MRNQAILAAAAVLAAISATQAETPAGYPESCAAIDRCGAISDVALILPAFGSAPQLVIASSFGKATVHRKFEVHQSKDNRFHVCMRYDAFGDLEVTCMIIPARGF